MSYEGYSQFWCKKGHYWTEDAYTVDTYGVMKCPICNNEFVFENMVDVTNGSFDDDGTRIDNFINPEIKKKEVIGCKNCGKEKICECSLYKIPKKRK